MTIPNSDEPDVDTKVRDAWRDCDLIASGWRPSADILDAAPFLDKWMPIMHRGLRMPALAGKIDDHPRLRGSRIITTSPVLWVSEDRTYARCLSRWYRLGQPLEPVEAIPVCEWRERPV